MSKKMMKCDQCQQNHLAEDTYVFEGATYCNECAISLIYAMCDYGLFCINFDGCERRGIQVYG